MRVPPDNWINECSFGKDLDKLGSWVGSSQHFFFCIQHTYGMWCSPVDNSNLLWQWFNSGQGLLISRGTPVPPLNKPKLNVIYISLYPLFFKLIFRWVEPYVLWEQWLWFLVLTFQSISDCDSWFWH